MNQGHSSRPPPLPPPSTRPPPLPPQSTRPPPLPPLPPPMPATVVTELAEPEERISFVPEDDIEGGRLHVMYDRLRHDDYAGALLVAQSIIAREPDHHDAWQCLDMCNAELRKLYVSRMGALERIPQLVVESEDLPQRVGDERTVQLLQLVNGLTSLGVIVERSGMPAVEALRLLSELYLCEVIEFEDE